MAKKNETVHNSRNVFLYFKTKHISKKKKVAFFGLQKKTKIDKNSDTRV